MTVEMVYAFVLLTENLTKEQIFEITGCTSSECNFIWDEIEKIKQYKFATIPDLPV